MRYKLPGHERKTVKTCALETQILLGNVKPTKKRKERAKETKPRDRAEDRLRTEIIKALRKAGCTVFRLEPSTRGRWGLSDLLVFTPKNMMIFMEIKIPGGLMSEDQISFYYLCSNCGENFMIVTSAEQALGII